MRTEESFVTVGKRMLRAHRVTALTLLVVAIVADIVVLAQPSDLRLFALLAVAIVAIRWYRLKSSLIFALALLILGVMTIAYALSGPTAVAERAASWLFFVLLTGVIQQWFE